MSAPPETRFARTPDGIHIAYQVVGEGPPDLVYIQGWITHLELVWEGPAYASFLNRLASFSRVLLFDKRGTGLSDRVPVDRLPNLHERMNDVATVMDIVGVERAALFGVSEGGPIALEFAAAHPERTTALIMFGGFPRYLQAEDYPWGWTEEALELGTDSLERVWQDAGDLLGLWAPSQVDDEGARRWWARYLRMSSSPSSGVAMARMNGEIDVRDLLPRISTPTLVMHRTGDFLIDVEASRLMARTIPNARMVEFPGNDHLPFWEGAQDILDEIEEFLTGTRHARDPRRVLTTVLFTDIVGSTQRAAAAGDREWAELLDQHHARVRRQLEAHGGSEVDTAGDGFLATFDSPAAAVRCGLSIARVVTDVGLEIRAGVHTGEVELLAGDVGGIAVHIGARVAALAGPSEVLVSQTVKDLVVGSGLVFENAGEHELKGVPDPWRLYRVVG
jgi:pimeloyl-ACP methyl ester carboxylesterase